MQLTIPAVSVIHRNGSPLPAPNTPPQADGPQGQAPLGGVLPCFPLGQVTQTIQPVGLETLGLMGLTGAGLASTQLLNATLGLQVLTTNPPSQSGAGPPTHVPGLQIVNIALPAIIPSLSPLSALSPLPGSPEAQPEAGGPPSPSPAGSIGAELSQTVEAEHRDRAPPVQPSPDPPNQADSPKQPAAEGAGDPPPLKPLRPPPASSWHKGTDDDNEASSDDEDRLVIAT